jgi:co-chaperonin GroES (HSP10)
MKAKCRVVELSVCLACVCGPLLALNARPVAVAINEFHRADRQSIEGRLTAKSDTTITVNGKVIAITATTSFMKAGKSILATDVQTGDNVKVIASRGTDGPLVAESVEVLARE